MTNRTRNRTERPVAPEAGIRVLNDQAAQAAATATFHQTEAFRIVAEAEAAAEQMRGDAARRAEEHREHARKMAADHVAAAEEEAAKIVARAKAVAGERIAQADAEAAEKERGLLTDAEENLAQAHRVAQDSRDKQAAAEQLRDYLKGLGAAEASAAGLPAVTETLTDGELDVRQALAEQNGGETS